MNAVALALAILAAAPSAATPSAADAPTTVANAPAIVTVTSPPASVSPFATPRNAVSLHVLSLAGRGVSVQGERLVWRRLSLATSVGFRAGAAGDYGSTTFSLAEEARLWLQRYPVRIMGGPYLGLRSAAGRTHLTDDVDGSDAGALWSFTESLAFGYRFAPHRKVEVTPSFALGARTDYDPSGRLGLHASPVLLFDLTVGWLF